jgi:hypothetical protein
LMFSSFLIAFWQVKVLFRFPNEPLAPLWVARLCRAKYCNCRDTHRCARQSRAFAIVVL